MSQGVDLYLWATQECFLTPLHPTATPGMRAHLAEWGQRVEQRGREGRAWMQLWAKSAKKKPPVKKTEQGWQRQGEAPEVGANWLARPIPEWPGI